MYLTKFQSLRTNPELLDNLEFKEQVEKEIIRSPRDCYLYARHYLKARWPEGENTIKECPHSSLGYTIEVIKGRWPQGEKVIMSTAATAAGYASQILKARWPEAEEIILQDLDRAVSYTRKVIKSPWHELELLFLKKLKDYDSDHSKYFKLIDRYLTRITYLKGKYGIESSYLPELLKTYCSKDSLTTFSYMRHYKLTEFPEATPYLILSRSATVKYVLGFSKKRWEEAEPMMAQSPHTAYEYATTVLKGRFEKGEVEIMKSDFHRKRYLAHLKSIESK